jgi:hypothetical protein
VQLPVVEQPSARVAGQAEQELPLNPQWASVGGLMHAPDEQQPSSQPMESQTQLPVTHRSPGPHGAFAPHLQTPDGQLSDWSVQALHCAPWNPHCVAVSCVMQLEPLQQPPAQLVESHPVHFWLKQSIAPHEAQAAPPVPH